MRKIRYAQMSDRDFWFSLDRHLSEPEFENKVNLKRAYVLTEDTTPVGILRYNLFWDNTPFCTLLYISPAHQRTGCGRALMEFWEEDMRSQGYTLVLTSTQSDEPAQHFYRALGYHDCGGLIMDIPGHNQPMELFLMKAI